MKKKIKEKDLNKDFKYLVVLRYMLNNPEKHWEYIRLLYAANILSHTLDSILQELDCKAPYMTERKVTQRMKNANKAFNGLVDTLLEASKEVGIPDKYEDIVNVSIKTQSVIERIINDIAFWGVDEKNFRWVKLNESLNNLISNESIEREKQDYFSALKLSYNDIINDLHDCENDNNKKQFMDACEQMIIGSRTKKVG